MWRDIVERWHALTKEQKLALVFIGIAGIAVLGLSMQRMQNQIMAPFLVETSSLTEAKKIIGMTAEEEAARQRRIDTDGDGLSDWDEENSYRTNPNLRDSCGDGVADNMRVLTGRNLACLNSPNAQGYMDMTDVITTSTDLFEMPGSGDAASAFSLGSASGSPMAALGQEAMQNIKQVMLARDPAAIRASLKEKIPPEELEKISDEELLMLYDAALDSASQQNLTNTDVQPGEQGAPDAGLGGQTSGTKTLIPTGAVNQPATDIESPGLKTDWKGAPPEDQQTIQIK